MFVASKVLRARTAYAMRMIFFFLNLAKAFLKNIKLEYERSVSKTFYTDVNFPDLNFCWSLALQFLSKSSSQLFL